MSAPLAGRTALVTGVSRRAGIGYAIARRLAEQGADLFAHAFTSYDARQAWGADRDGPAALCAELAAGGRRVHHAEADLGDPGAPAQLFAEARRGLGRIDILVLNHAHSESGGLEELTAEQIDRHLAVNVRAALLLVQAFAAQPDLGARGRVVWLVSGTHRGPMPGELAYAASKGALQQLTRSLAAHLAPRGITLNAVNPGATDTGWATPDVHAAVLAQQPRGRWGLPDDAARLVAFLCGDDAAWITGQVIDSTGGGP